LLLIPIATELGLYCVRAYCHLAKCQCRSKNFNEKRFHPRAGAQIARSLLSFSDDAAVSR
jgi:hypothetical protein